MTSTKPAEAADLVAPWIEKLPAEVRAEAAAAREAARDLSPAQRIERAKADRAAEAEVATRELRAERAARRWAMWCEQVPAVYRDERADPAQRRGEPFAWWLSTLSPDQHATEIAAWLCDPRARTLILFGPTGTGKTHAAMLAGYAAAAAAVHVRYISQLDYLRQLRPGGTDEPMRLRERFALTSLLILDDFGAETGDASQFVRQETLSLLDERLAEGRRQILTTNLEAADLADVFGDRIMSRLRADAAVLKFAGKDRRSPRRPW